MCHPAVVIGFQALSAVMEYQGQKEMAEATYDYKMEERAAVMARSADAARHQYQGHADRMGQSRQAAAQDVQNATRSYMEASASGRVAAARGGVMGSSVEATTAQFAHRFEEYAVSRMQNLSWEESQILANARGTEAQHRGRVEGTMFAPIAMPSPFKAAAQIAGSVFSAYDMFPEHGMFEGWA